MLIVQHRRPKHGNCYSTSLTQFIANKTLPEQLRNSLVVEGKLQLFSSVSLARVQAPRVAKGWAHHSFPGWVQCFVQTIRTLGRLVQHYIIYDFPRWFVSWILDQRISIEYSISAWRCFLSICHSFGGRFHLIAINRILNISISKWNI